MTKISQNQLVKWYEAHEAELMLYAKQWHAEPQAEDIVQDAFIKLLNRRKSPENIRAWLFRVVRNGAISRIRSIKQEQKAEQQILKSERFHEYIRKDNEYRKKTNRPEIPAD